jgi:beta-glucosidase
MDPATASEYVEVVDQVEQADIAILRLAAPFEPREGFLRNHFHQGDLDFKGAEKERLLRILDRVPAIVAIYLDRPAVIPEIAERCAALLADFGANDAAVLDVICGQFAPTGKLPFELPASMEAVRQQKPDVPHDSEHALYPFGHGLSYEQL